MSLDSDMANTKINETPPGDSILNGKAPSTPVPPVAPPTQSEAISGEESFAEVALRLRDEKGLTPVFIGSDATAERERAASIAARTGGIDISGRTDLPTLAAVFAAARLFIGNDSGPMHLAAAVATPTVGIFGSTAPAWTAPRGSSVMVVGPAPAACSPCFRKTCPFDRECLTGIGPDDVLGASRTLLEGSE